MRRILSLLLSLAFALVAAAALAQNRPPKLEPLPEPGGPDEPRVRIPVQKEDKVEPIRDAGRVIALKVTPPNGKPYYLIDTSGNGNWMRKDSLDDGVRVPMWPIKQFD